MSNEKPCCANCQSCKKQEMWGVIRSLCGDPTESVHHEVTPEHCCINHTPASTTHIEYGLTMDIWY